MRRMAFAVIAIVVVSLSLSSWFRSTDQVWAQQAALAPMKPMIASDGMIALSSDLPEGRQQVVVIDTKTRVMSVYHIEHAGGMISLKSVRNITADFLLDEFNTNSPLPRDIRAMKDVREKR